MRCRHVSVPLLRDLLVGYARLHPDVGVVRCCGMGSGAGGGAGGESGAMGGGFGVKYCGGQARQVLWGGGHVAVGCGQVLWAVGSTHLLEEKEL